MLHHPLLELQPSRYIPHGHCYLWQTPLVGLHVTGDLLIAIAYFSIPISLIYFIRKHQEDFPVRLLILFGLFIMLCGVGHLIDVVTLWYPIYWVSGIVKAATAIVSVYTAFEVIAVLPYFLSLEDPEALAVINQKLEKTFEEKATATKELEESQRIFSAVFHDAPIGMALISIEGVFLKTNRAITNFLGYSESELLETNFKDITHPDDLKSDLVLVEELISGQRRFFQFEKRYFHKLGQTVTVQLSVSLLRNADDTPLYFNCHIQDISQQKQATASLLAATRASEAANKAKSNFLATMSHEIRTPMNAMIGMSELLADTPLNEQQQDFVEVINKSGNTLLSVVNDILDFSKIESNKLELEIGYIDLYECTEDVLSLFSNQAEQKGISLTSLIEPANIPKLFKGDATRLRQIMSNLISNSLKFTESGEVSICIKVTPTDDSIVDGEKENRNNLFTIACEIKDTGIGIPKEKLCRLFKSFSQVDASTTRQYGGTGLGLAISKRLIEMMNGEISVESEVGVGSTFIFSLQLEAYEEMNEDEILEIQIALKHKKILVVGSNQLSRKYLRLQAESWELQVDTVDSAEATLVQLFRSDPYDLIVLDESLSDMDNIQLASQIRNFPNYQTTPLILFQSRRANTLQILKTLDNKARILHKPFRRSQFYNTLIELLLDENIIERSQKEPTQQEKTVSSDRKPLRILLTEDISLNQKVAIQMLSKYGYTADIANNGKEAVEALQKQPYDLVFMDVQMPVMDGLTATKKIRKNSSIQQPYIIAMTAHAMQGDREECLSVGMNDYVGKPIRKQDLAAALQRCVPLSAAENNPEHDETQPEKRIAEKKENLAKEPANLSPLDPPIYISVDVENVPLIDKAILEGVSSEKTFLYELCSSFFSDSPQRVEQLRQNILEQDAPAIQSSAHALKSLSGCVGAMSLFQVCKFIEDLGKRGSVESVSPLMRQVDSEYEKVKAELKQYQENLQEK